jgi:hypothetical protein
MVDPFAEAFENVGADFSAFMAGAATVTVRQINPDDGTATATAPNVTALKRSRRRQPFGVSGGELSSDQCRFILRASEVGFLVKARDEIVDAEGVSWHVESANAIAFNQLYACDVVLKR